MSSNRSYLHGGLLAAGLLLIVSCRDEARVAPFPDPVPDSVLLVMPDDADPLVERLAGSTAETLTTIVGHDVEPLRVPDDDYDALADLEALAAEHRAGLVVVLQAERLAADVISAERLDALGDSGFVLQTHDVGQWANTLDDEPGATIVLTAAHERLPTQYAAYELLRRMGVRFFHPEQEYVPTHDRADLRDLARRPTLLHRGSAYYTPDFQWRSWSFHSAHPLEHLEAFSDPEHPIDEAEAVNDWIVKGFGNRFRGAGRGAVSETARLERAATLDAHRELLGFARGTGISLHNLQQGASAEIDEDSEVPVQQQIEALVELKLSQMPDARWFGIHFGPTEFTTTPDAQTVQWIDWAGRAALRLRPDIEVVINNHITGGQPSPNYDDLGCPNGTNDDGRIDYYDLAFHTDPRLGISAHTVMFYPLEGPARVYNQQSFEHKRCLMEQASAAGRPLHWFPEGSWWLSFDNSVPMYLPLYMATRARDIELLRPLLPRSGGTLIGHRMFNSGHEWGYWQQDYAVALAGFNADITIEEVLGEMFDPLCPASAWRDGCAARNEAIAVLTELMEHQADCFLTREDWSGRPGGLYTYFAGQDQADIIAATEVQLKGSDIQIENILNIYKGAIERLHNAGHAEELIDRLALTTGNVIAKAIGESGSLLAKGLAQVHLQLMAGVAIKVSNMSSADVARWAIGEAKEQGIKLETNRRETRADARSEAGRAVKQAKAERHFLYELDIARLEKEGRIAPGSIKGIGLPGFALTQKWLGSGVPRDFRLGVVTMIVQMVALNFAMKGLADNDQFNQVETRFKAMVAIISLGATMVEIAAVSVEKSVEHPLGVFIRKQWAAIDRHAGWIAEGARLLGMGAGIMAALYDIFCNAPQAYRDEKILLMTLYGLNGIFGFGIAVAAYYSLVSIWWPLFLLSFTISLGIAFVNSSELKNWISRCEFSLGEKFNSFDAQLRAFNRAVGM